MRLNVRAMDRRLAKLEKARRPQRSPIVIAYGSFEAFTVEAYAEIWAGKLDQIEMLEIIEALRGWEAKGVWMMAYANAG